MFFGLHSGTPVDEIMIHREVLTRPSRNEYWARTEVRIHHEGTKDTKGSDIILLNFVPS